MFGRLDNPEYRQVMSAHMADSSYDVDAGSGSVPNRMRPQNNRVVANIDVIGDPVNVEASGGDTTPALTGGTASKKGGKFGKTQYSSRCRDVKSHCS